MNALKAVEKQYFSVTETAAIIRRELKTAFPGVKFSVKSKRYSGGSSIDVAWLLGPFSEDVKAIVGKFQGADFDGMTDCTTLVNTTYEGKLTHFAPHHIFCNREIPEWDKRVKLAEDFMRTVMTYKDWEWHAADRDARKVIHYQREGETILEAIDRVIFGESLPFGS